MREPPEEALPTGATSAPTRARRRSAGHYAVILLGGAGVLALLAARLWLVPDPRGHGTHEALGLPPCPLLAHLGVPCPTCGVTTAFTLAARGHPLAALATQPVGLLLAVAAPALALGGLGLHLLGRDAGHALVRARRLWPAALALVLVSWAREIARVRGWF